MRLAKQAGRLHDFDRFVDEIPAERLRELVAFDKLHGIDDDRRWRQLYETLGLGFSASSALAFKRPIDPNKFLPTEPVKIVTKKEVSIKTNILQQKALLRQVVMLQNSGQ